MTAEISNRSQLGKNKDCIIPMCTITPCAMIGINKYFAVSRVLSQSVNYGLQCCRKHLSIKSYNSKIIKAPYFFPVF